MDIYIPSLVDRRHKRAQYTEQQPTRRKKRKRNGQKTCIEKQRAKKRKKIFFFFFPLNLSMSSSRLGPSPGALGQGPSSEIQVPAPAPAPAAAAPATPAAVSGLRSFIAGGVGGVCAVLTGHPFDLVKVRLQTAEKGVYSGAMDCVRRTIAREGPIRVRGFIFCKVLFLFSPTLVVVFGTCACSYIHTFIFIRAFTQV